MGSFWEPLGSLWEASGKPLGSLWEASGKPLESFWKPLGSLWEASGKPLGSLWEAFWEPSGSLLNLPRGNLQDANLPSLTPRVKGNTLYNSTPCEVALPRVVLGSGS